MRHRRAYESVGLLPTQYMASVAGPSPERYRTTVVDTCNRAAGQVRQRLGNPHPALAVAGKLKRTAHKGAGTLRVLHLAGDPVEVRPAVVRVERRLRVEQVHLAGAAVHEQVDDRPGLGREVRRPRFQVD